MFPLSVLLHSYKGIVYLSQPIPSFASVRYIGTVFLFFALSLNFFHLVTIFHCHLTGIHVKTV
jgi:hypothetical protein